MLRKSVILTMLLKVFIRKIRKTITAQLLANQLPVFKVLLCVFVFKVDVQFNFNKELNFPAVTFCNLSPLRRSALVCSRFDKERNDPSSPCSNITASVTGKQTAAQIEQEIVNILRNTRRDTTITKNAVFDFNQSYPTQAEYALYGFRIDDMLIRCTWNGQPCSSR